MNIGFYVNSDTSNWHLNKCQLSGSKYNNIDEFIASSHDRKYSIMQIPCFQELIEFEADVHKLARHSKIILLTAEVHHESVVFIKENMYSDLISFICGALNFDCKYHTWMYWFLTSTEFYKQNNVLDKLKPYNVKPKTFDILLGQPKPHRSFIYNFAKDYQDKVIMTYFKDHTTPIREYNEQQWIWEQEGLEIPDHDFNFTVTKVKYHGYEMSLSQVVPINIYNETAYTIVCETNYEDSYSFFTEKIVKPILARRLFIVYSGQYYLRNLRQLGFQTFDGIIDESYDSEPDVNIRGQMIVEQMKYLFDQDQQIILEKINPIVEYNRRVMLETDWYGNFSRELQAVLLDQQVQN